MKRIGYSGLLVLGMILFTSLHAESYSFSWRWAPSHAYHDWYGYSSYYYPYYRPHHFRPYFDMYSTGPYIVHGRRQLNVPDMSNAPRRSSSQPRHVFVYPSEDIIENTPGFWTPMKNYGDEKQIRQKQIPFHQFTNRLNHKSYRVPLLLHPLQR